MPIRKIDPSPYEPARNVARAIAKSAVYRHSRHERKKVQMLFAHLKRILRLDRLQLKGPRGAQDEFVMVATAQNLRRMAMWVSRALPKAQVVPA